MCGPGEEYSLSGADNLILGEGYNLFGAGNPILGEHYDLCGEENLILGEDYNIFGAENPILGEEHNLFGAENPILDEEHNLFGANNPILGEEYNVFGAKSWAHKEGPKSVKSITNKVPVVRHGFTLGEDEAAASRKVSKPLPGPPEAIFGPQPAQNENNKTVKNNISPPYFWSCSCLARSETLIFRRICILVL